MLEGYWVRDFFRLPYIAFKLPQQCHKILLIFLTLSTLSKLHHLAHLLCQFVIFFLSSFTVVFILHRHVASLSAWSFLWASCSTLWWLFPAGEIFFFSKIFITLYNSQHWVYQQQHLYLGMNHGIILYNKTHEGVLYWSWHYQLW